MPFKRLNYYYGQFLKENDFRDEQTYHINGLLTHNRNLHSWGIASGLDVSFIKGKKYVTLDSGMAVDEYGRQIIFEGPEDIDVSHAQEASLYLTISFKEKEVDPVEEYGTKGNTRIIEEPQIELKTVMPDSPSVDIFLCKIILNSDKTINSLEKKGRKNIGVITELSPNIVSAPHVKDRSLPLSKVKTRNVVSVTGTISPNSDKAVAKEVSDSHRFFMTSVIPTSPGLIEWRWISEIQNDKLSYILMIKNPSNKEVSYEIKYYDMSEK